MGIDDDVGGIDDDVGDRRRHNAGYMTSFFGGKKRTKNMLF